MDMELFKLPAHPVLDSECESPPLSPVPGPDAPRIDSMMMLGPVSPKAPPKSPMRQTTFQSTLASPERKQLQTLSDDERAATMALMCGAV
jgi:hypothetical protein